MLWTIGADYYIQFTILKSRKLQLQRFLTLRRINIIRLQSFWLYQQLHGQSNLTERRIRHVAPMCTASETYASLNPPESAS